MRHNKKSISVVNVETGEIVLFESQAEFARVISVNRSTINKWKSEWKSNRILKGVWVLRESDKSITKHKKFLLETGKNKECGKCHILLALDIVICPICNTRQ